MKTPKDFDYDLWITEDGKCMVRVKSSGKVTEVSRPVMRILRAEEKRMRRELQTAQEQGHDLFLELQPAEEVGESWLADTYDATKEVDAKLLEQGFVLTLTTREQEVYRFCIKAGQSQQAYADASGLSVSRVCKIVSAIRKKAKKYF